MNIKYFREAQLEVIKSNTNKNLLKYKEDESWVKEYFSGEDYCFSSNINIRDIKLNIPPKPREHKDLENTIIIYDALKDLTIPQATDERLWAYLSHVTFWEYMRVRWDFEKRYSKSDEVNFIKERYFCSSSKGFLRNGISRLWWYGYSSYDKSYSDPYTLTKVLLRTQDVAQNILERSFSRNQLLTKILLRVLHDREKNGNGFPNKDMFRQLSKSINRIGGVTILDALDENDIEKIVVKSLVG